MFFIMGISQGRKKLNFDQLIICPNCGKYGHLEVYMVYSYLMLFFIPVFKWGRSYCVRTTCCDQVVPIDAELGRQIERGEVTSLPEVIIPDHYPDNAQHQDNVQYQDNVLYQDNAQHQDNAQLPGRKRCGNCGFETEEDFQFCPKCGNRM